MRKNIIYNQMIELLLFIEKEEYKGWDPYDAMNCKGLKRLTSFHPLAQKIAIHFFKNSPINFRNLLKIKKEYNPTALSLFLDSYVNFYHITGNSLYLEKAQYLRELLLNMACVNTEEELGWSRNFDFMTTCETHEKNKPLTFLNAKIATSFLKLFYVTKDESIKEDIRKAITGILRIGKILENNKGTFLGYSSEDNPRLIFNVNIMSARLFLEYISLNNHKDIIIDNIQLDDLSYKLIEAVISSQHKNGKWNYGYSFDMQHLKNVDFHQGFIVDSFWALSKLKHKELWQEKIKNSYKKGVQFLHDFQITEKGTFLWRHPKEFPIDIHNQAQGIITLSQSKNNNFVNKLEQCINYTFNNFWDKKQKFFYYQKTKLYTIKIPYIRWSEGWMLYALTEYIKNQQGH